MEPVILAQASDGDWGPLAKSCASQLGAEPTDPGHRRVGFLYVTDVLAGDLTSILTFLKKTTNIEDWVGTVGIGTCASGRAYFDRPAVVAMALTMPHGSVRIAGGFEDAAAIGAATSADAFADIEPGLGIIHGDPRNPQAPDLVAALSQASGAFLVGGLTASRAEHQQVAGGVMEGGLSGLWLDRSVAVATGLSQGCSPIGPTRVITAADGQILAEIDGEPALRALEADLGATYGDEDFLERLQALHVALPVAGSDTGDYLVRNLSGLDPENGYLAVGEQVAAGDRIMFCRRDAESAAKDLRRMLDDLKRRAGAAPRAGLYYSCVGRGPNLFDDESRELAMIGEVFGDLPLVGFFGNGEISHDRLYGYTGVLTLFL